MPRPDFPETLQEFHAMFPDEEAAFAFVAESRWPDGWKCPRCGHGDGYGLTDRYGVKCKGCGYLASVTAGTVMHKTRKPILTWLYAAWMLVVDKRGTSAAQIERQLGLRHETAFMMLHKLRAGLVAPDRTMLTGTVEVDETYIGGGKRGRPADEALEKMLVIGAVEVRLNEKTGKHYPGRVRFRQITGRTKSELLPFVADTVEKGSVVVTDGLKEYAGVKLLGYRRSVQMAGKGGFTKADVLPRFHLVVSNLKAWLQGTFHGAVSKKHLQAYLNEFAFRFNRRRNLYAAFQSALGIGTQVRGPEYEQLYRDAGEPGGWAHPNPPHAAVPTSRRKEPAL